MGKSIILLKQGEMILKGGNRRSFEQRLLAQVQRKVSPFGDFRVTARQSVVFVEQLSDSADIGEAFNALRDLFGINSLSLAQSSMKDLEAIACCAAEYLSHELTKARSFKVETKRADKRYPISSIDISRDIGGRLHDLFPNLSPQMRDPELTVNIEVREDAAFVYSAPVRGAGGLPAGSSGSAVALLSGGIDSPVAMYLAAKRGLRVSPVHFFSFPYTSQEAKQKVIDLSAVLSRYCGSFPLRIVSLTEIQEEIAKRCPDSLGTVITRRFMTRIASRIAAHIRADALITGENLGQVASQTVGGLTVSEDAAKHIVLRPLICYDKQEIIDLAVKIGTYQISSRPFEDCCTVFTPRHPSTRPNIKRILEAESILDIEALTHRAYDGIEVIKL